MISKWNYLPLTSNEQQIARTLGDRYPKVPALCKLLAQRGVTSAAEAEKFFKPQLWYISFYKTIIRDSTTISPTVMKRDTVFPTKVSTMPPKTVLRCSSLSTAVSKP